MSEQILLLNPRRSRRRKYRARRRKTNRRRMPAGLRRYWAAHRRHKTNPSRRRRYRHRTNRRRTRRYHHRTNRRTYRRRATNTRRYRYRARHRRTNPRFRMPRFSRGTLGRVVTPAVIGAAGGVILDMAWGALSKQTIYPIPASLQAGWAGLLAKLGVVFGGAWIVNKLVKAPRMRLMTQRAVLGATTVLAYGALKGALQSVAPSLPGLSGYMDYHSYALPGTRMAGYMPRATLGSLEDLYSPAAVIQPLGTPVPRQFGGYIAHQPGMGAYQAHTTGGGGLMGYDWQSDGM